MVSIFMHSVSYLHHGGMMSIVTWQEVSSLIGGHLPTPRSFNKRVLWYLDPSLCRVGGVPAPFPVFRLARAFKLGLAHARN